MNGTTLMASTAFSVRHCVEHIARVNHLLPRNEGTLASEWTSGIQRDSLTVCLGTTNFICAVILTVSCSVVLELSTGPHMIRIITITIRISHTLANPPLY